MKASTWIIYVIGVICEEHYYRLSCWKNCEPVPHRYYCDSDGNEYCVECEVLFMKLFINNLYK